MVAATLAVMLVLTGGMLLGFSRGDLIFWSALALPVEAKGSEGNLLLPLVLGDRDPGILDLAAFDLLPGTSCPGAAGSPAEATNA
jgi:hypothetical protein